MYIVATPQDTTSWLLYRGGLLVQWNLCIVTTPQDPTSWLLYRGGLLIQWNLCIVATPQDPTSWLLYTEVACSYYGTGVHVYSGHPSGPNQLAAIQSYSGTWANPSGPNYLAAIQKWPAHTVEPVYSGHPSGPNHLAAIQKWPAHTVEPVYSGHPSGPNQLAAIYRGGLIIEWKHTPLRTQPVGCYTEVACSYS